MQFSIWITLQMLILSRKLDNSAMIQIPLLLLQLFIANQILKISPLRNFTTINEKRCALTAYQIRAVIAIPEKYLDNCSYYQVRV